MFDFDVRSGGSIAGGGIAGGGTADRDIAPTSVRPQPGVLQYSLSTIPALRQELAASLTKIPLRPPVVVAPSTTIQEAMQSMTTQDSSAAVVASHGVLLGTLTTHAVLRRLLADRAAAVPAPVWKVMSVGPDTLLADDTVAYAIQKLRTAANGVLPIVGRDGTILGMLDSQQIVAWLCDRMNAASATLARTRVRDNS